MDFFCLVSGMTENKNRYQRPPLRAGTCNLHACLPPPRISSQFPQPCWVLILIFSLKQSHFSSSEYSTLHRSLSSLRCGLWFEIPQLPLDIGSFPLQRQNWISISLERHQRSEIFPVPISVVSIITLVSGNLAHGSGQELDGISGSFQPKPSYDSPHLPQPSLFAQELDLMLLLGPFQLCIFCDSMTLLVTALQSLSWPSYFPVLCFFLFLFSGAISSSMPVVYITIRF